MAAWFLDRLGEDGVILTIMSSLAEGQSGHFV
jgi:hypothetical protein